MDRPGSPARSCPYIVSAAGLLSCPMPRSSAMMIASRAARITASSLSQAPVALGPSPPNRRHHQHPAAMTGRARFRGMMAEAVGFLLNYQIIDLYYVICSIEKSYHIKYHTMFHSMRCEHLWPVGFAFACPARPALFQPGHSQPCRLTQLAISFLCSGSQPPLGPIFHAGLCIPPPTSSHP